MKMEEILKKYSIFRANMNVPIDRKLLSKYWNLSNCDTRTINIAEINNPIIKKKISIVKERIDLLIVFKFVKFVGVSGSVASGFAKEEDDIDIFVVVKNDRAWIYRALVLFRNIFHKQIRMGKGSVKDKLCLNFISEERGLEMESDIFNLNELLSLVPIFNPDYLNTILLSNRWIFDEYLVNRKVVDKGMKRANKKRYPLYSILNLIFFLPQLFYMIVSNHNPDFKRIWKNYKQGRLEFFPDSFRKERLEDLEIG